MSLNAENNEKAKIHALLDEELHRQKNVINLIASENLPSEAVMQANAHPIISKYAEGYPGARYYGGCEVADKIEKRANELLCEIFGSEGANVQPHSGTQANQAVYQALLKPGGKILSLDLAHGGHLSHGSKVNFSYRDFQIAHYKLGENELLDYPVIDRIATEFNPDLIIAGASTYSRFIDWERFRHIADRVNAFYLADIAHYAGLIAGGVYPNPTEFADVCSFTTQKTLRGPRGGAIIFKKTFKRAINRAVFPGCQGGPNLAAIAAKGIAFEEVLMQDYRDYTSQVVRNARVMSQIIGEKYHIVSGGTDCHMFTVRLEGFSGARAEEVLEQNNIVVNKQMVPNDQRPPKEGSGIRIGTPYITTLGYTEEQSKSLALKILHILSKIEKNGIA